MFRRFCAVAFSLVTPALAAEPAAAASVVFGLQPTTGAILTIDPVTGAILNSFATPAPIAPTQGFGGLTFAADINELLYFDSTPGNTLFRLSPTTGALQGSSVGDQFAVSGLSYERNGSTDHIYYGHTSLDLHRQAGFGGGISLFFGPVAPTAGLGGDGYGRQFAITSGGFTEFDPLTGAAVNSFGFGSITGATGLAFDGVLLYVSTTGGALLTLDPNTGAVLNSVSVSGGTLVELGAAAALTTAEIPEPATVVLLGLGLLGAAIAARRRSDAR